MTGPESSDTCKNCGASLKGEYCHACGQSARIVRRPVRDLLYDIFNHLLQWDNRLFYTLKRLFLQPGQLSVDWVEGKRMRYVPPFRLYIIASFILFLLFGLSGENGGGTVQSQYSENPEISRQLAKAIEESENQGEAFIAAALRGVDEAARDPEAYFSRIKRNLPKAAFLLLPVFGCLHMLMEMHKKKYLIDYFVFSLHLHAFTFTLIAFILLMGIIHETLGSYAQILNLGIPVYTCLGMRRFNNQGLLKSCLKTILILSAYLVILGIIVAFTFTFFLFV